MRNLNRPRPNRKHRRSFRFPVLGVVLVCVTLCVCLTVGTTLAFFSATKSMSGKLASKNYSGSATKEDGTAITQPETLEIQAADTPYTYVLTPAGDAAGYCRVDVTMDGTTTTNYISPLKEPTKLNLYAAAGSLVEFTFSWGSPNDSGNVVSPSGADGTEKESGISLMRMSAGDMPQVVLDVSSTPAVVYTYQAPATLRGIAAHYGVTEQDILVFNELDSEEALYDGMDLYIPNPVTTEEYTVPGLYRVGAGETLESIAQAYNVTVRSLRQWNNIYDGGQVGEGTMLRIPVIYQPDPEDELPLETAPEEEQTNPTETQPETAPTETAETQPETTQTEPAQTEETTVAESTAPADSTESTTAATEPAQTEPEQTQTPETKPEETTGSTEPESTTETTEPESTTEPTESEPTEATVPETQPETTETTETTPPQTGSEKTVGKDGTVYLHGVPMYFQNDYPDVLYGNGTVKSSGCSVTSLTMVANAITGYDYTVDELADYFGGVAGSNTERLETGSDTLGLKWERSENWNATWKALQEGKIVIALMDAGSNPDCLFTNEQHFIVLTGLNSEGKILVNDPNADNYEVWNLKNGFEKGFAAKDILPGYSAAWIYDRTLETQPARYTAYRPPKFDTETNNGGLTRQERYLLACLIWGEARGESIYGQQAVAEVVLNRLASGKFGDSIAQVICGEGQFRSVTAGQLEKATPTQAQYQAIDRALFGKRILPENIYYFAVYAGRADVYIQVGNHLFSFNQS